MLRNLFLSSLLFSGITFATEYPSPNPPSEGVYAEAQNNTNPSTEWIYHYSQDRAHPNGNEQQMIWLMNRARQNPTAEGEWLASSSDFDIANGRNSFNVNLSLLRSEFASYAPKPPAAFDSRLYEAAKLHSEDLIARDAQDHNNQFNRVSMARFYHRGIRGNVFSYAKSSLNAHAGFNIDWGTGDGSGMQPERGHRKAIMAIDGNYTNVGIAMVEENNPYTSVGPYVTTGNYAIAKENGIDHFNSFIVGTIWQDKNGNGLYDNNEGIGNILVQPNKGQFYAITSISGGYAIPITATGSTTLTFSSDHITQTIKTINVTNSSILVDYQIGLEEQTLNSKLINISTRGWVGINDNVMIAGFIIKGGMKKVLIIAKGLSLASLGVPQTLVDPFITLYDVNGTALIVNDNWIDSPNANEIRTYRFAPQNNFESAILTTLQSGAYTVIVRGVNNNIGNALIEVYEVQ